jgi:tRNA(adenine34) deaminase
MVDLSDKFFMKEAIKEAKLAAEAGDIPIGAVIVFNGKIIGRAHNQMELLKDPTAHAEMIAITQAASAIGDWRLNGMAIYVTKEPCQMCAGAINLARISKVVYGVSDPVECGKLTAQNVVAGIMGEECLSLMQNFFQKLRKANKN